MAIKRGPAHAAIARSLKCEVEPLFAALDRTFHARARGACGTPVEVLRSLAAEQGARPSEEALHQAVTARVAAVRADARLRPDALAVLRTVRSLGLRTAVVSDCWYELPEFLPQLSLARLLDVAVFSLEVGHCKPHPAIYLAACERLGLVPEQCLYVGDGGGRELSGAQQVGMAAVQLAARDLAGHLTFDPEPAWGGPTVRALADLVWLLQRAATKKTALVT